MKKDEDVTPEDLLYNETHEWVSLTEQDGSRIATVGITAFAVEQLTDLVYMELPPVGTQVSQGAEFGEVESVKAVSPLYSPVTGEIIAVNETLPDNLDTLSEDPYTKGWVIKVRVNDEAELANLLDLVRYQKQCEEEG